MSTIGDASGVPRVGLLGRTAGEADSPPIGGGGGLAVDRFRNRKHAGRGQMKIRMAVDHRRRNAEGAEHRVIERLGFFQIVGSDHDIELNLFPSFSSERCRLALPTAL